MRAGDGMLKRWDDLPGFMRTTEVRPYWELLNQKRGQLVLKRVYQLYQHLNE